MDKVLSLPFVGILFVILTLLSFLFSASETSIISLSRIRLRHMVSRGLKRAQSIQRLISNMDKFISAILVLNNFVNIAMSAIITAICLTLFSYKWAVVIATFATSFFIVIALEITPKIIAIKHTERVALFIAPIMEVLIKIFNPIILFFNGASSFLIKLIGIKPVKKSPLVTEEELRLMIEIGKEEGFLSEQKGKMLHRILEFGNITVGDVMVPKEKMIAVDMDLKQEDILNIFVEEGHARLPVYKDKIENVVGVIYARDLLYILKEKGLFVLQDLVHDAYKVSATCKVNELLHRFQTDKIQMAVVVDKDKKTVGLVTLEDLIEEIVGEIEEKHHRKH
ncbi:MAG: hemolysin family protein [Candidatus Omnitrophica bacterium]|nr:hemolysin family protein [Candidatus Omnitrophota bacterium]